MTGILSRENVLAGLREPGAALGILFALLRARWYCLKYRLKGVRLSVGKNLRCHGRLVIAGQGTVNIGDDVVFQSNLRHVYIGSGSGDYTVEIGSRSWLNGTSISCHEHVTIGEQSLVGRAEIIDHEFHDPRDLTRKRKIRSRPVILGENTWIGNDAMIMKGVEIGEHSVVGARTVVRRSVPPQVVVIGNPARIVKEL
jgi:UDP-3-O-[3-hydroxymyristoyl] glucosamine N-acyltransferase